MAVGSYGQDTDFGYVCTLTSRVPGLTPDLQGSVNIHRGALLFVPQWQCISSIVFSLKIR